MQNPYLKEVMWCKEQGDYSLPSMKELKNDTPDPMKDTIVSYLQTGDGHDDKYYWFNDLTDSVRAWNVSIPNEFRDHIIANHKSRSTRLIAIRLVKKIEIDIFPVAGVQHHVEISKKGNAAYGLSQEEELQTLKVPDWVLDDVKEVTKELFIYDSGNKGNSNKEGFHWSIKYYAAKGLYRETVGYPDGDPYRLEMIVDALRLIERYADLNFGTQYLSLQSKEKIDVQEFSKKGTGFVDLEKSDCTLLGSAADLLLKGAVGEDTEGNIVISPVSIMMVLAMLAKASANKTREQICDYIGSSESEIWKVAIALQATLNDSQKILSMANSMFVTAECSDSVSESFQELLFRNLSANIFDSHYTAEQINTWVSNHTRRMIPRVIHDVSQLGDIAIINAIAFEAKWRERYEVWDVTDGIFHNISGIQQDVEMLKSEEDYYIFDEIATGFIKPYKDCSFAFMALLPQKTKDPRRMIQEMPAGKLFDLYHSAFKAEVDVTMPEFRFDYDMSVKKILETYGVTDIFDEDSADLSNMISIPKSHISNIIHKAHIEVDRTGTRAAAVTMAIVVVGCAPMLERYKVVLDRPFAFAIVDMITGIPVFQGIVETIEK